MKHKLFVQYWGQFVKFNDELSHHTAPIGPSWEPHEGDYLKLKELRYITDEEAIEVCKLISSLTFAHKKKWTVSHIENGDASYVRISSKRSVHYFEIDYDGYLWVKHEDSEGVPSMVLPDYISAYDYLRSRGFALPFMGVTVEEQIKNNWICISK